MSSAELREKFLEFFRKKGHEIVPSSSLIPDDPSVLLTTAGMQQFKKYYTGELDFHKDYPKKIGTTSVQKCFRTSDIDEVGDESHLTFFEMLGNFSFGGYFKEEAIKYAHEFITKELGLKIDYVSIFGGDSKMRLGQKIPPDAESEKIWRSLGIRDIRKFGREDNFWGPTGFEGPCGPTTEIYINGVEIWNIVFNEYYGIEQNTNWLIRNWNRMMEGRGHRNLKLRKLETLGIDTGMGLERLAMVSQNKKNIFETDLFKDAFKRDFSGQSGRIVLDHIRGAMFLISEGVRPSNKEAGYVLRRLMRRAIFHVRKLSGENESGGINLGISEIKMLLDSGISFYGETYEELKVNKELIIETFRKEHDQFINILDIGSKELNRILGGSNKIGGKLSAKDAFDVYQSFGFPREVMKDFCEEKGVEFDDSGFDTEFAKHQEISKAGQEKKFGGHGLLLDTGELKAADEEELKKVTRLHTATHLLQAALRKVLGDAVEQRGSDITSERTRFDFLFPRKLTPEELKKIEVLVNYAIEKNFPVTVRELPLEEAKKSGALFFYKGHYPESVKVYTVGNGEETLSKELCGGPHVSGTGEIGKFKIIKEEASSAGVRRIRAVVK